MRVDRANRLSTLCEPHLDAAVAERHGEAAAVRSIAHAMRVTRVEQLRRRLLRCCATAVAIRLAIRLDLRLPVRSLASSEQDSEHIALAPNVFSNLLHAANESPLLLLLRCLFCHPQRSAIAETLTAK